MMKLLQIGDDRVQTTLSFGLVMSAHAELSLGCGNHVGLDDDFLPRNFAHHCANEALQPSSWTSRTQNNDGHNSQHGKWGDKTKR